MPPSLSRRIQALPASAIRKYLPMADGLRTQGVTVFPLNIGQPDVATSSLFYEGVRMFDEPVLSYAPSAGDESLRQAISRYYERLNISVSAAQTIITSGASEALMAVFDLVCDPGDEVIVFEPFYTNYQSMAGLKGVKVVSVATKLEEGFALPSIEMIEQAITPRTKAVLMCNPNNPTGSVVSKERLVELVELAKRCSIFLIVDEVYREFVFEGERATSVLEIRGSEEVAIVVDSVSKRYSACGARIGWLVLRREDLMNAALKYAQMRLSVPTVEQRAFVRVLDEGETDIQRAKREYATRRDIVFRCLQEAGIPCGYPAGALYLIADIGVDAELFTQFMLKEYSGIQTERQTVLTTPAQAFYATAGAGKTQIRIAFVIEENGLKIAMKHLIKGREEFLEKQKSASVG
ncbi:pyridoxal phosphate-dependent aminotransferase [Patescibacteria group bacterium]|nr:pyridoxal phosphate-dependent aminotransferase [Patescibacteria group bacterium]MBP9709990.1 pyridoxal phosphate-dependent aminotransferase [Patescibacteria group bacterium]